MSKRKLESDDGTCENTPKVSKLDEIQKEAAQRGSEEQQGDINQKINYKDFFEYTVINHEHIAICLECTKTNISKKLKMKNRNTTGLKKHLESKHKEIFKIYFSSTETKQKEFHLPKNQTSIHDFMKVNIKKNYNFRYI